MKKIVVASLNPIKLEAVRTAFVMMFPGVQFDIQGTSVRSEVKDQPSSDQETYQGAYNRALNASLAVPQADFYVGLEGGVEDKDGEMESFAWMIVRRKDGRIGKGRTATFFLAPKIAELIRDGKELGEADDIVFGKVNSKQAGGAVGLLTDDAITRKEYYTEALAFALIPFKNEALYF